MERICPFLATGVDGRTVVDGFDGGHICRAVGSRQPLDRGQQVGYCLTTAHTGCDRYVVAMEQRGPISWPAPAADAAVIQTRLVLPAASGRRAIGAPAIGARNRRWVLGGAMATLGLAAVASGVAGSLGGLIAAAPSPAASGTPVSTPRPTPATTPTFVPTATPAATSQPTSAPSTSPAATLTTTPSPTPPPQPQTYVVQPGDTLNGIATRFGTSVQALQAANGLGASDVIIVGQVLIIP
jgi:LysM repeat protein